MSKSSIEWTEQTWNPTTGCTSVSDGCKNCYARRMHKRLTAMGHKHYSEPFSVVRTHEDALIIPYKIKKPTIFFVNSMSDIFHKDVDKQFILKIWKAMVENPQHIFQVLTKRIERAAEMSKELNWPKHIWLGTSIEDDRVLHRLPMLKKTGAKIKFISLEPLLGPLPDMNLKKIDWAIIGGESGPYSRPMEKSWVLDIQKQCKAQDVMFFFKQWGGVFKKQTGRLLNGREYNAMPMR